MSIARAIRTLIVDDEPLARSNILTLLRNDPTIEILGECGSGAEALRIIRAAKPDLIFLDIEMPELDGFDVVEMLGADQPRAIIFVTAYDQYAVRAFDSGALDYLLKPFDDARFHRALDRARERIAAGGANVAKPSHITLKSAGQILFLKLTDIDWIEAADYYTCLHTGPRQHLLRRSITDLEDELDPEAFCRIHRSAIVRLDRVQGLKLNESGDYDVLLHTGVTLRLSRTYRPQLQSRLGLRSADSPVSSGQG
ncbi:LytR/AlgR family response regulator transcription factor [Granulicella mallensis]|uniref:Two component transcriptional regulator, LytTR family n=1 Tax=Granulicella mallensis (strain ATCC BAA-1857 / DSM 23137 / MP5ACTX8) TaxID=682795 RepID=G8P1W5_GRAMM|nr:LytTR family DNA-binding domain-containing protein [Granulicella mallensis]AEU37017.1 two component transcriptional regulator, LytTR family [Granulicella mallensis MP5ACTX8]